MWQGHALILNCDNISTFCASLDKRSRGLGQLASMLLRTVTTTKGKETGSLLHSRQLALHMLNGLARSSISRRCDSLGHR